MREPKTIINEIALLLEELNTTLGIKIVHDKHDNKLDRTNISPKGAFGAVNMLIDENFFDSPREISVILEKLKEVGHFHKNTAVAMNLLNLTKRRILNRFKNKETKNWEYVIRK